MRPCFAAGGGELAQCYPQISHWGSARRISTAREHQASKRNPAARRQTSAHKATVGKHEKDMSLETAIRGQASSTIPGSVNNTYITDNPGTYYIGNWASRGAAGPPQLPRKANVQH